MKPRDPRRKKLRVAILAVKNTVAEQRWLLSFLRDVDSEPYRRGGQYDLIWFLNVTSELRVITSQTDMKTFVVGMEPKFMYPLNYDPDLLSLSDYYMGYLNFASAAFKGTFIPYTFPIYPRGDIQTEFPLSMTSTRDHDFCLFATHDPNIRRALGSEAKAYKSILAGPLFDNRVSDKRKIQRRCRYELITENDINDYYFSEKLGQALLAGCVPVYWGCQTLKSKIPPELFVDMSDFSDLSGVPDVKRVIEYCLTDGVYENYQQAIQTKAFSFLTNQLSIESCLIDPLQQVIDELNVIEWRAKRYSMKWTCFRGKSLFRKGFLI